jgi:hypothetical protein
MAVTLRPRAHAIEGAPTKTYRCDRPAPVRKSPTVSRRFRQQLNALVFTTFVVALGVFGEAAFGTGFFLGFLAVLCVVAVVGLVRQVRDDWLPAWREDRQITREWRQRGRDRFATPERPSDRGRR